MIITILISAILFIANIFGSNFFWSSLNHRKAIHALLTKSQLFQKLLPLAFFIETNEAMQRWINPLPNGYKTNLALFLQADHQSKNKTQIIGLLFLILIFLISYFVGWIIFAINIAVFLLSIPIKPTKTAIESEIETLLIVSKIIYLWHNTNTEECKGWIAKNTLFRPIFEHIISLSETDK